MPIFAAAALPFTMSAIGAGATATGAIVSGHEQASAANNAAKIQSQSADKALQFEREQAARDQANFEATQKANYDQYAARQGDLSTLGNMVGLPSRNIPAYVPTTAGSLTGVSGSPTGVGKGVGDAQGIVQSIIQKNGLKGHQADPTSLQPIIQGLQQAGFTVAPDKRNDGLAKGVFINGQFVKLLDGSDNWIYDPLSAAPAMPKKPLATAQTAQAAPSNFPTLMSFVAPSSAAPARPYTIGNLVS